MNLLKPKKKQKNRGQGLVEFALVAPILLTLLYGIFEAGRYVFVYGSTVTAARQAARYGSATENYTDCDGIKDEARKTAFLNTFENNQITITYVEWDEKNEVFTTSHVCDGAFVPVGGDIIVVKVDTTWKPIVPLVPLLETTFSSTSKRTILDSVEIEQDQSIDPNNKIGRLTVGFGSPLPTSYYYEGETLSIPFIAYNTGVAALTGEFDINFTVNGTQVLRKCGNVGISIAENGSYPCPVTYTITAADVAAGVSSITLVTTSGESPGISKTIPRDMPSLELTSIEPTPGSGLTGTDIVYKYILTNTGNVELKWDYIIEDDKSLSFDCGVYTLVPLAPGSAMSCTGPYKITATDESNGEVINTARAKAIFDYKSTPYEIKSDYKTAKVLTSSIFLALTNITPATLSASAINEVITYTYTVTNNSGSTITLTGFTADNATLDTTTLPSCIGVPLTNGNSTSCKYTHTVLATEYDLLTAITNEAQVSTTIIGVPANSNKVITTVALAPSRVLSLALVGVPTTTQAPGSMIAGTTVVAYTYAITNTGNTTYTEVSINNGTVTPCGIPAPGATINCIVYYTVTQADIDAGSFTKTATASGLFNQTTTSSNSITTKVVTFSGARFTITAVQDEPIIYPDKVGGQFIKYTYTLTNTGDVPLTTPVISTNIDSTLQITGTGGGNNTYPETIGALCTQSLGIGETMTCTRTYNHLVGTGTSNLVHSITAASFDQGAAASLPANLNAKVYSCTTSNFTKNAVLPIVPTSSNKDTATWIIRNKVGIDLPITYVEIERARGALFELDTLTVVSSPTTGSTITTGTLPNIVDVYRSGSGVLKGNSGLQVSTTYTFDFSKNSPTMVSASISIAAPFSNCIPTLLP